MLKRDWFYNKVIQNAVAVFGTVFNDVSIVRHDGSKGNLVKVPLSYGPKKKYLARIDQQENLDGPKVAIKLPRMSFELLDIEYDTSSANEAYNKVVVGDKQIQTGTPYILNMQLNIMSDNQSDALQILEQILPHFRPAYVVSARLNEGIDIVEDVPIVLQSVQIPQDYEGDFMTRNVTVYTLDFQLRVKLYTDVKDAARIKQVFVSFNNPNNKEFISGINVEVDPRDAEVDDNYEVVQGTNFVDIREEITITYTNLSGDIDVDELATGMTSLSQATVLSVDYDEEKIVLKWADGLFEVGETLQFEDGESLDIVTIE